MAFALVWLFFRRPYWLMFGWGFHILVDIFSHSASFFPTPFLFPLVDAKIDGWNWGSANFMLINYFLLFAIYGVLYKRKKYS